MADAPSKPRRARILAIDLARGLTIVWMILVDNQVRIASRGTRQGSYYNAANIWYPFAETDWFGLAPADLVFPTFIFIMGATLSLAAPPAAPSWRPAGRILLRACKLFVIGALLNLWAANFAAAHWIFLGVLQRLGLCYLVVALLSTYLRPWAQRAAVLALVVLYQLLMSLVPTPGCGAGALEPGCNAAVYLDTQLLTSAHMPSSGNTLPEGFVSTLTACATCYLGLEAGRLLQGAFGAAPQWRRHALLALLALLALVALGLGANFALAGPCKKLWTLSFACFAAACSAALLALCALPELWPRDEPSTDYAALEEGFFGARGADSATPGPWTGSQKMSEGEPGAVRWTGSLAPGEGAQPAVRWTGSLAPGEGPAGVQAPQRPPSSEGAARAKEPLLAPMQLSLAKAPINAAPQPRREQEPHWAYRPFLWLGRNPIVVFVGMVALETLLMDTLMVPCPSAALDDPVTYNCNDNQISVWAYSYMLGVASWATPAPGSFLVALAHLALWLGVCALLHARKIFITL